MKSVFLVLALTFGLSAQASDLKDSFKKLEGITKGPFELNYLQGTKGRTALRDSSKSPPGVFLFQAAYRNSTARGMADEYGFFTGNLFTTNYYELTGRFVYNDPYGNFALDHKALASAAAKASDFIANITRNWVLERSYVSILPHSRLARAFNVRGISGAEFEYEYATYYFNIGLTAISEDFQFLPLFLLAKSSPLTDAAALDRARNMITQIFEAARAQYGESNSLVRELYAIRNAIHNQVSADVISRISSYLKKYPKIESNLRANIVKVQEILVSYYNINSKEIERLAKESGQQEIQKIAQEIGDKGYSNERGLKLSNALANVRILLTEKKIVYENQTKNLILLAAASQYLNKELSTLKSPTGKEPLLAVVNLVFAEGYLIRDNWEYFKSEVSGASSTGAAAAVISDLIEIGTDTLNQAFEPTLSQWLSIEPKLQYFVDNTMKASALNTAAHLAKNVK